MMIWVMIVPSAIFGSEIVSAASINIRVYMYIKMWMLYAEANNCSNWFHSRGIIGGEVIPIILTILPSGSDNSNLQLTTFIAFFLFNWEWQNFSSYFTVFQNRLCALLFSTNLIFLFDKNQHICNLNRFHQY